MDSGNRSSFYGIAQAGSRDQADMASVRPPASNKRHHSMVVDPNDGVAQKRPRVNGHAGYDTVGDHHSASSTIGSANNPMPINSDPEPVAPSDTDTVHTGLVRKHTGSAASTRPLQPNSDGRSIGPHKTTPASTPVMATFKLPGNMPTLSKSSPVNKALSKAIDNAFERHGPPRLRKAAAKDMKAQAFMKLEQLARIDDKDAELERLEEERKRQKTALQAQRRELARMSQAKPTSVVGEEGSVANLGEHGANRLSEIKMGRRQLHYPYDAPTATFVAPAAEMVDPSMHDQQPASRIPAVYPPSSGEMSTTSSSHRSGDDQLQPSSPAPRRGTYATTPNPESGRPCDALDDLGLDAFLSAPYPLSDAEESLFVEE